MPTVDTDAQLAGTGDMEAFEKIYRRHHKRVYSLCLRMTRNVYQAEDLAQDVFVQVFRKINTFRGDSSFSTWLHRLAVNQVLMQLRKPAEKRERPTEDGDIPVQILAGTENPRKMAILDRVWLEEAVRLLPQGYRTVLILHDVEGYEHEEIGRLLGCAVGTSKSQLHKARRKLRTLLIASRSRKYISRNSTASLTRATQPQVA